MLVARLKLLEITNSARVVFTAKAASDLKSFNVFIHCIGRYQVQVMSYLWLVF